MSFKYTKIINFKYITKFNNFNSRKRDTIQELPGNPTSFTFSEGGKPRVYINTTICMSKGEIVSSN